MTGFIFRQLLPGVALVAATLIAATAPAVAADTPTADTAPDATSGCQRGMDTPPPPPPGGYGPACAYLLARGIKDDAEGYFFVTMLYEYANGVLINVQDFERFIADGRFVPQSKPDPSSGN